MKFKMLAIALVAANLSLYSEEPLGAILDHGIRPVAASSAKQSKSKTTPSTPSSKEEKTNSRFQIGANYSYVHITTAGNPSTHGNLGGAQASYEYRASNRIYGGLVFAWREGTTEGGKKGDRFHRSIHDYNVQERIGYTFGFNEDRFLLSLFSGFGYRHLGEKVNSLGGLLYFYYNEFYVPVGLNFDGKVNSIVSLGLNFQWMPQVYPTVKIVPLNGARWILTYKLDNFLVEFPITFRVSEKYRFSLIFTPFFESWHDGHSTAKTVTKVALNLPGNSYIFAGANLNFCYSF